MTTPSDTASRLCGSHPTFTSLAWLGRRVRQVAAALACMFILVPLVHAADFPSRPLTFVVPYPPGGPLDTMSRLLAQKVGAELNENIIVENKPGAGGDIGAAYVAQSKPDGYTLVMGAVATHAINPWLFRHLPYDPIKDFAPVTLVASVPNVLILNLAFAQQHHITDLPALIAYARAHPNTLTYGSGGNGSAGHLSGELLKARAGITAQHVPYQGAAPAELALISGQVDFVFDNLAAASGLIQGGRVAVLAVTTATRSPLLPKVPTVEEAGVKDFDLGTWFGVFAPAHTPAPIIDKLYQAYAQALRDPEVRKQLTIMGSASEPMPPAQFAAFVSDQKAHYQEIVKLSGAQVN